MTNRLFLKDEDKKISYDSLIAEINSRNYFYPKYQTSSLFDLYVNLLIGLISNRTVVLLDSDISRSELSIPIKEDINVKEKVYKPTLRDFEDLIDKIQSSSSVTVIFTSGTTGQPKEVRHSFSNLSRAVKTGERFHNNIWGFAYNPTHMAGLQVFFQALINGNPIINIFNKNREFVLNAIEHEGITHISATPTFYRLLLPYERAYLSVLRVSLGGEKSGSSLYDSIKRIFPNAKVTNIYASTEAGTLFATQDDFFKIPDAIKNKFKIVDDELYIHKSLLGSSPSFKLIGDFYASGDLIEWIDKDNRLFRFKSRKNELINVGGYKVNPTEVEEILRIIPGVRDAYVYGKKNSILGNVLCADILMEDKTITENDIRNDLKNRLQDFKIPRRIKFVETLSLTRTGKMSRK